MSDQQLSASVESDVERAFVHVDTLGKWTNHVVKRAASEATAFILAEVERKDGARQIAEDARANHRNLNRMLTLLGALFIGLALTWLFTHPFVFVALGVAPSVVKALEPYTFVITIFMDSSLAAYSFFKRY